MTLIIFPALLFVIFIACVATLYTEGMWGNAIRLINVVTAALLAVNFWEPLARWLEGFNASFCYFWDFLALWGLFGLFMVLFRLATDFTSRVKVRFLSVVDRAGSVFFAIWVGWVMVCFTAMSLHTAPLARNFLFGGFDPQRRMFVMAPDRQWLGFVQKVSRGSFSRTAGKAELDQKKYGSDVNEQEQKLCVFDRKGEYIPKYATRRANLEAYLKEKKVFRVLPADVVRR